MKCRWFWWPRWVRSNAFAARSLEDARFETFLKRPCGPQNWNSILLSRTEWFWSSDSGLWITIYIYSTNYQILSSLLSRVYQKWLFQLDFQFFHDTFHGPTQVVWSCWMSLPLSSHNGWCRRCHWGPVTLVTQWPGTSSDPWTCQGDSGFSDGRLASAQLGERAVALANGFWEEIHQQQSGCGHNGTLTSFSFKFEAFNHPI